MTDIIELKKEFQNLRATLLKRNITVKNSFNFCINYSLLIEEFIIRVIGKKKIDFAIVASGSFSRRELSPYSDIDIMFLLHKLQGQEEDINAIITQLWDIGIEVSHTVKKFSDIEKFLNEDLHTFTQFFETRFIAGNKNIYQEWNKKLFNILGEKERKKLILQFIEDIEKRHLKYGDSPKVLEPSIKYTAGGLRDLQAVEWIYSIKHNLLFTDQNEITSVQRFLSILKEKEIISSREITSILDSYSFLLAARNALHIISKRKNDRLEFSLQELVANKLHYGSDAWKNFMSKYFNATGIIHRFSHTMIKRYQKEIEEPISDHLIIPLDEDFSIKGNVISLTHEFKLSLSDIIRTFYYRALHNAIFDHNLRSKIIERTHQIENIERIETKSSVFFREILNLPQNIGVTISVMNELELLGLLIPEFKDLIGFFQPGVYHCYTADEHTIIAIRNLESLKDQDCFISRLFDGIKRKDLLYLSVLFHDIGKPISLVGHEIIGAEIVDSLMNRLGYSLEENYLVQRLVKHHLDMEQTAFRRNLNDPATLDNFLTIAPTIEILSYLYLLTYADLSAVSPVVWTQWKSDLLYELYSKIKTMLLENISGETLLLENAAKTMSQINNDKNKAVKKHVESINDLGYLSLYSQEEINQHVLEIEKGNNFSLFFKQQEGFTNITIITNDFPSLLSRLCGAISINDLNIHDARIFTRTDGIIIDSFNVTDFRTHQEVDKEKFDKIRKDIELAANLKLHITKEFNKVRSKWKILENKLFGRKGKIKIEFEEHKKYTIIDVFSPDRLGLLYNITKKLYELGISIYSAKISTKGDDVVDTFYVLRDDGKKIGQYDYELIRVSLIDSLTELM